MSAASGLEHKPSLCLYEGNYQGWIQEMDNVFTTQSLGKLSLIHAISTLDASKQDRWQTCTREAARTVAKYVRPQMLARVRDELRDNIMNLVTALRKLATPFRLFDLPAELRELIYEATLCSAKPVVLLKTWSNGTSAQRRAPKPPALLQVSRRIREEALSIYYSMNEFSLDLVHFSHRNLYRFVNFDIIAFATRNADILKHLRSLTVRLKSRQGSKEPDIIQEINVRYILGRGVEAQASKLSDLYHLERSKISQEGLSFGAESTV